ncbi:hypothetical protein B0T22DRAFT_19934 [Podospora appendiculata]|uniref:Zn(2)-C6 fungal-type domain-containing protein n=1 Tax=Podospora appendiculata TaxID=314037 RepID=A0AAE1CFG7_9PEZI|nr:hypothetical protein B0T22DRAFT_19934 [Podospora appendiculata]
MASVASAGTSPLSSNYEYPPTESTGDPDENLWTFVSVPNSSGTNSVAFFPSPAASGGSLGSSWGVVGHGSHLEPSPPPGVSPLNLNIHELDFDQQSEYPASAYSQQSGGTFGIPSAPAESQFIPQLADDGGEFMASGMMSDQQFQQFSDLIALFPATGTFTAPPAAPPMGIGGISHQQPPQRFELDIPQQWQSPADVPPWDSTNPIFVMDGPGLVSPSPPQPYSPTVSPAASGSSPRSPVHVHVKRESGSISDRKGSAPIAIRKVRDARVQKKKSPAAGDSPLSSVASSAGRTSKFFIVTPDSVNAHADKPNPFECFEAMRPSQRGRKGPLANDTKENALEVRRRGACFCCHARKVKCDKERPCRNCKKLCLQVPQAICWRFQDFQQVLFPEFIRGHFRKDEMNKFITENIQGFTVNGAEKPCNVELFSGNRFSATLSIKAKFFTAKTAEVLQHWHMQVGRNTVDLQARGAVPIGLEPDGGGNSQRDELRKKVREYIHAIVGEPTFAELVTEESRKHTEVPSKILRIVQDYSRRCDAPMVKRALSIYAMHHVMSRHLCLTRQTIINLGASKLVPQNETFVTPRVLNRQIKSVIDEMMIKEMTALFENFSKSLKPKSRREFAPCLAAFLVLCLFMEAVEAAADTFVMTDNEIALRTPHKPSWKRSFALAINREVENLPFKQFAFQFHQIYQTHSRDSAARSFNPLADDECLEACLRPGGDLEMEPGAADLVRRLRHLVQDSSYWSELDYLTADPILPNDEDHPFPRDTSLNYNGRLVSKFLLSFTDERYIFGM